MIKEFFKTNTKITKAVKTFLQILFCYLLVGLVSLIVGFGVPYDLAMSFVLIFAPVLSLIFSQIGIVLDDSELEEDVKGGGKNGK